MKWGLALALTLWVLVGAMWGCGVKQEKQQTSNTQTEKQYLSCKVPDDMQVAVHPVKEVKKKEVLAK